jgi:hypothetical protein
MSSTSLNPGPFIALGLQPWPIVVIIHDCYIPRSAREVVNAAKSASPELIAAILACRSFQAHQRALKSVN